mgnify:CR=1 FL=1
MAYIDEKQDKFYNAINHYAEEQRQKIQEEISSFKEKELEQAENEVLTECYYMIQREMSQMRSRIARDLALKEMDLKRSILQKRQGITDDVFRLSAEKLKDYAGSERYGEFLKKSAQKIGALLDQPGTVIFYRPGDEKYEAEIRGAFGSPCSFQTDETIRIGGIRARNDAMGLFADETLDALLESQREWFEEQSGMAVV